MKTLTLSCLLCVLSSLACAGQWVHSAPGERFVSGDFNGDGFMDAARVSTEDGTYQIVFGNGAGDLFRGLIRASGAASFTGLAAGRVEDSSRDSLIFAEPMLNRLLIMNDSDLWELPPPRGVRIQGIGPSSVVALASIFPSANPEEDLFVLSTLNSPPQSLQYEALDGGTFFPLTAPTTIPPLRDANPMRLKPTDSERLVALRDDGEQEYIYGLLLDDNTPQVWIDAPLGSPGHQIAFGNFEPGIGKFLAWTSNSDQLKVVTLQDMPGGTFTIGTTASFSLPEPIQTVIPFGSEPQKLLVMYSPGNLAAIYTFDGVNPPDLFQALPELTGGDRYSAAIPLDNDTFALFRSSGGGALSSEVDGYRFSAEDNEFQLRSSVELSRPSVAQGYANASVFAGEPFVDENPIRLMSVSAPDWSVLVEDQGGILYVESDMDFGMPYGLFPGGFQYLGPWPQGGTHGFQNQWADDISVFSLEAPIGAQGANARISPEPGVYGTSIQVSFAVNPAGANLFYRFSDLDPWQLYLSPFWVYKNTTVSYTVQPALGLPSSIQSAAYQFTLSPDEMDSDGDGIPDYAKIGLGLDPGGGPDSDGDGLSDLDELIFGTNPALADSDGDGYSDLQEIRAGTDPLSDLSVPADEQEVLDGSLTLSDRGATFDFRVRPETVDENGDPLGVRVQQEFRIHGLDMTLLGVAATDTHGHAGIQDPSLLFSSVTPRPVMVTSSPLNFLTHTQAKADMPKGRSIYRLDFVSPSALQGLEVPYAYGGGDLAAETANWVAALLTAHDNYTRPQLTAKLDALSTAAVLLLEIKAGELLFARGLTESPDIRLHPNLPGRVHLPVPSESDLLSLLQPGPSGEAAVSLAPGLEQVESELRDPPLAAVAILADLIQTVYLVHVREANAAPGILPFPDLVLKDFFQNGGPLPVAYTTFGDFSGMDMGKAYSGALFLLGRFTPRPMTTRSVQILSNSPTCTLVQDGETPIALLNQRGRPYPLPFAFDLIGDMTLSVTGYTDVESSCAPEAMEVLSLHFVAMANTSPQDLNGNLLPDGFEQLLGGQTSVHTQDSDGDGYSDLQELLDGTDPLDAFSTPLGPVVDLSLPEIELKVEGAFEVEWSWPAAYQDHFSFTLQTTDTLSETFQNSSTLMQTEGTVMKMSLPSSTGNTEFYRIGISLR